MATNQNIASRWSWRNGVVMPRSNEALATIAYSSFCPCQTAERLKELALRAANATDDDYDQALIDITATLRETKHHPENLQREHAAGLRGGGTDHGYAVRRLV